jgi:hypothetical protein
MVWYGMEIIAPGNRLLLALEFLGMVWDGQIILACCRRIESVANNSPTIICPSLSSAPVQWCMQRPLLFERKAKISKPQQALYT